jgi:hypothetical protein
LFFSLCLYDTFLTMIDLNSNSLLIDIYHQERETLSTASAIGNAFGKDHFILKNNLFFFVLLKVHFRC